ncbi:hypothetical protein TNIN_174401 [Trichonephila inaurata madagascariensis]|uniref:Phorbol-ester/DAG-type domain-containing protein n=1 Tax=Trichonephila inaurata madagascariensis TaxID=2747483 RepID=A0A8X7CQI0_9ARAC|nr:hypothetical protein TNIN_174401 [Trichonephila inaurata madagascariensis]
MAEIAFYRSQYKYVKGDDSEISLEVGTFVEYLRTEVLAPPTPVPQRPVPRPESVIRNIEESNDSGYVGSPAIAAHLIKRSYNQHSLIKVYFLTPVLCRHCRDYIWGTGKIGVKCEGSAQRPDGKGMGP